MPPHPDLAEEATRAPEVRQEGAVVAGAATGAVDRDHMVPEDPDGPYVFQFSKTVVQNFVQTKFFFKFNLIRMTCMGNLESRSSDTCGRARRAVLQPVWNWRRP